MNIPIKIKRSRGRPKKSVINIVETSVEPEIVETQKEPIVKPVRKVNKWVDHCTDVKNRKENVGKSYREILKIAKLDYNK
jgi:hypothetical protein